MEERIRDLQHLNTNQGKYKSQRGGVDTVWCRSQIPWPQNHVLGGSSKARVSYDSLSMSQWVSGCCAIIREEGDLATKNAMLDYMTDLMEDSHDFGWPAAKASHAVLLCKMEDNKINWLETEKIDRIRRVHAQRSGSNTSNTSFGRRAKDRPTPCRFFQKGQCSQKGDHESNGHSYLHVCATCFTFGKTLAHPSSSCRRAKNEGGTA